MTMVFGSMTAARRRAAYQPRLEALEERYCPTYPPMLPNIPPTILSFAAMPLSGQSYMLTGTVADDQPAGISVQFSGKFNGTATTNSSGAFMAYCTPCGLGQINAVATDTTGLVSNTAQVQITSLAPAIIEFNAHDMGNNYWVFSGRVQDENPAGLTVQFGGLLEGRTATVQADGTFMLSAQFEPGACGEVTAQVADVWGLLSAIATYTMENWELSPMTLQGSFPMFDNENRFQQLADQARDGDERAKRRLQSELQPALARIVKRVLRCDPSSSVHQRIAAAVRRLTPDADPDSSADRLALAKDLGRMIAARLHPSPTESWLQTVG
jgi:hypothetical protein